MPNADGRAPDEEVNEALSYIFGDEGLPIPAPESDFRSLLPSLRSALLGIHVQNSRQAIRLPKPHGAFPGDLLASVPPIVPDANRLRDDILYTCGRGRRTSLVNAANAGLIRLFSAQHVLDEIVEHSAVWTAGTDVTQAEFLHSWLTDYLPLIRVVRDTDIPLSLLSPEESERIAFLQLVDPDDVPSAILSLTLGAFYLTNDQDALGAVYGPDADLSPHAEWIDVLKAGGDASELGQMLQVGAGLVAGAAQSASKGVAHLWTRVSPLAVLPIPLLAIWLFRRMKPETRTNMVSAFWTAMAGFGEIVNEYQSVLRRFEQASPATPTWESLAQTNCPADVLARACLHTLARLGLSGCSAKEVRSRLPPLPVAHGEAKVREVLRAERYFVEAWAGRWQVGAVAEPVRRLLQRHTEHGNRSVRKHDTG
jgi:hypothetical protein